MKELSIIIPARSEPYLQKTIDELLTKIEGDTEIFVFIDEIGKDFDEIYRSLYGKVGLFYSHENIGQRAAQNYLAKLSTAKYLLKCDAHVLFSKGFDVELMKEMDDKTIMAPVMLPLDAENWQVSANLPTSWFGFDPNLITQVDKSKQNYDPISESMCLHGSAWIINRETYWKWNVCDESFGSWGKQGTELGIKAFLNGGTCKVNKNCYYAHLERHKEADFPYQRDMEEIKKTRDEVDRRLKNKSIAPLIEKFVVCRKRNSVLEPFNPVASYDYEYPCGWTKELVDKL